MVLASVSASWFLAWLPSCWTVTWEPNNSPSSPACFRYSLYYNNREKAGTYPVPCKSWQTALSFGFAKIWNLLVLPSHFSDTQSKSYTYLVCLYTLRYPSTHQISSFGRRTELSGAVWLLFVLQMGLFQLSPSDYQGWRETAFLI